MEKNILNSLKKLEQLKFEDGIVVSPSRKTIDYLPFVEETYIYIGQIVPNRMIKKKQLFEITSISPLWILNGFAVTVEDKKVIRVIVFGNHPNKDWKTGLFCLPEQKIGIPFTKEYFDLLIINLKTFYLDNCYSTPRKNDVTYRKMKSVFIQLNEGDE